MYDKAEKYYEAALELLAENYEQDASLGMYFDRNFDFTEGNKPGPDIESVPRAKTSRSIYNEYVQHSKAGDRTITPTLAEASKADIKAGIVERALVEMATTYAALENTLAAVKTAKMAEDLANAAKMKRQQQVRSKLSGTREL